MNGLRQLHLEQQVALTLSEQHLCLVNMECMTSNKFPIHVQTYLVGGAVRDELLGLPVNDRDYVVVGATADEMLQAGFAVVGSDFPVFLHPHSGEEYALARTERKSGKGYAGFVAHASPDVTLEQDLERRDFTINAMAKSLETGEIVDPFGGQADLEARVLRHVSPAFSEDPLRVLRAARFMARFKPMGFTVAEETKDLMRQMVDSGEVDYLVPERVLQELRRALTEGAPGAFLRTLREVGALKIVLPEVDALYGVPQRADYHPEVDTGVHVEMVLQQAAKLAPGDDLIGYAALAHDLGKACTPEDVLPSHRGHEDAGVEPVRAMSERLKVPWEFAQLALIVCTEHLNMHRLPEMRPSTIVKLLMRMDAFRKPERVKQFATVCEADARGRTGFENRDYPQRELLLGAFEAARSVSSKDVSAELSGPAVGEAIQRERVRCVRQFLSESGLRDFPEDG